jgi:hypothetical protein
MGRIERGECNLRLRLRTVERIAKRVGLDPIALLQRAPG